MTVHRTILAATFALSAIGAAHAENLSPNHGQSIDLGEVSGVAHYTIERDGYRVVATLAQNEAGKPVRIEAVLGSGQSVVLSSPREAGLPPHAVEIRRQGDQVLVHDVVTN